MAHFGGKNIIAVRVDATKFEGWFYEGAGIYRHVWLDKTAPVAIAPDGIFVWSEFKNNVPEGPAEINVETDIAKLRTNQMQTDSATTGEIAKSSAPDGKSRRKVGT